MSSAGNNALRMPFAEWLFRMSEAKVDPSARILGVYAACFQITGNDELAKITGLSPRTFDRWKKVLVDGQWVIITQKGGGRGRGVEVHPALAGVLVEFTDMIARNPRKFDGGIETERGAELTPVNLAEIVETPAKITPVTTTETPAKVAPVSDQSAKSAGVSRAEVSNNIYNNNNLTNNSMSISELLAASAREGGTVEIGSGVTVNCQTITHKDFKIDLKAIELHTLCRVPIDEIRLSSAGHALDWAGQIADGKTPRDVLPKNGITNWIAKSFHYKKLDADVNDVRKTKASVGKFGGATKESQADSMKRAFDKAAENRRKAQQ